MVLVCIIADWSVSQLSFWLFLHSPVEHAAPYYIMNHFQSCFIKYLFDLFETAMVCIKVSRYAQRFDGIAQTVPLLMAFSKKMKERNNQDRAQTRNLKAPGTLAPWKERLQQTEHFRTRFPSPFHDMDVLLKPVTSQLQLHHGAPEQALRSVPTRWPEHG